MRSEEHTSELQSRLHLVCRLLLEKKKHTPTPRRPTPRSTALPDLHVAPVPFSNDTATPAISTLSLHDALPIYRDATRNRPSGSHDTSWPALSRRLTTSAASFTRRSRT